MPWHAKRRHFIVLLAALIVAGVALFARALFLGETFAERDLGSYHAAVKSLIAPLALLSSGIPQWNPFFGSGQPFAANPHHALFYPLTALFILLPYDWAFRLQVILPPLVAVPCMAWFLRVLGRSRCAALAGGLAWGLGGLLLSATNLLPLLFASATLPLSLGFVARVLRRPDLGGVAGLALALGLQALAGEPFTLFATALLVLATLAASARPPGPKPWLHLGAGAALALLLAAIVLLPGARHAGLTIRAAGLSDAMANEWSMPPVRALELFSPHVLGHVDRAHPARYWGAPLYGPKVFALYYALYPGLVMGVLALLAWGSRRRVLLPWAAVALVGYAIAIGDHFVLWRLLRHVPGLAGLRYPEKAAVIPYLAAIVAASHGFDWFVVGLARRRRGLLLVLASLAGLGAGLAVVVRWRWAGHGIVTRDATLDACRVTAVAGTLALALWLARRWRRGSRGLLVCGLLGLDLVSAGRALVPTLPIARVATPPGFLLPLIEADEPQLLFHMADWNAAFAQAGGLANPPAPARWGLAMTLERDFDFAQLRWTHDATYAWMEAANATPSIIEPLLARRGVTAIVKLSEGARWEGDRVVVPGGAPLVQALVARRTNAFAFAADGVVPVRGVAGWKAQVRTLGARAERTVCVEDSELDRGDATFGPAQVSVQHRTPMAISVAVQAAGPAPAFVAINQSWHPDWHAWVDGQPTRVVRTDLALSGVVVPPGRHELRLAYDDPWLEAGLRISLAAALACLGLLIWHRRRAVRAWLHKPTASEGCD